MKFSDQLSQTIDSVFHALCAPPRDRVVEARGMLNVFHGDCVPPAREELICQNLRGMIRCGTQIMQSKTVVFREP